MISSHMVDVLTVTVKTAQTGYFAEAILHYTVIHYKGTGMDVLKCLPVKMSHLF